jgi:hypothetical protein
MAMIDRLLRENLVTGLVIGGAVLALAPIVAPAVARALRPAAKTAFKTGLVLYARGREAAAELAAMAEDMMAEARHELAEEARQTAGTAEKSPPSS